MLRMRKAKYNLFGLALLGLVCIYTPQVGICGEQASRVGTLHIDGAGIERLVLQDGTGRRMVYDYREPNLVLPEGSHRLDEVILQGDYSSLWSQIPAEARVVNIESGGFTTIKLGAPLRQTIQVERWGASLVLKHQLLGQAGESYLVTQRQAAQPPAFVVYKGENKMVSGHFEPG